ncbi:MAG: alanine--tRNA ligase [Candidatus Solincola sediminis]|uniref:Alanine--tRNA ligase n=1 Tax=Candidatus Solincola sediminis TaxID=1797199 RepID=A0A1F2WFN4_9ACTN|nr:MAG: alanine--tRNA ligase [Candidatus Solincola sediminis]OFW58089.1 MAG: alanine--tRNA ligase [Candidatus Solincola sediminis]
MTASGFRSCGNSFCYKEDSFLRSEEIRARFLEFFRSREHRIVKSSSLIPDDPTLLITNAGMVQFKPYFLGIAKPEYRRATSCQKCARTTDIEKVGHTARHLTFFEMLGNFSFGDYYKKEAISWAWEFLTGDMGLDTARMYCSVYEEDDEAYEIWRDVVGVPEERLVRLGEEDNFWDMGTTGPCGPCSEILYDQGRAFGCGEPDCRPGCDCDRYLELWNLVFMQYDRNEKGDLTTLPSKNIDTGLGLERLASVMQGVPNNFETDTLATILKAASDIAHTPYGGDADVSLKIIADHARAMTFMIADGILPSNEDRGYILRRLIRRAVRHGRLLGITKLFLPSMVDVVVENMGEAYPELKQNHGFVSSIARSEEERFSQTLRTGLLYFEDSVCELQAAGATIVPGSAIFHLHDTLGFPLELTRELAHERGLELDEDEFGRLMEEQKERARMARAQEGYSAQIQEIYSEVLDNYGQTLFTGYETMDEMANVTAIVIAGRAAPFAEEGREVEVFLDRTPFYGEMGGQVGDTGIITGPESRITVEETFHPAPSLVSHRGRIEKGRLQVGDCVKAEVDTQRRLSIRRNHTATHVLHWALGQVLGEHAKQAGSLVDARHLRFDFTHFAAVTAEELAEIEELANSRIIEDIPVRSYVTTFDYASSINAVALFGEKYEDYVRVVEVDEISRELCGGTHVGRTGEIGMLLITSESGIGANMRRIEAVSGMEAYHYYRRRQAIIVEAAAALKVEPERLPDRVDRTVGQIKELEAELRKRGHEEVAALIEHGIEWNEIEVAGRKIITARVEDFKPDDLRELAEKTLSKRGAGMVAIATAQEEKASMVVAVAKDLTATGLNAVELAKKAGKLLKGGGGGRPDMAVGGGPSIENIDEALTLVIDDAKSHLE